MENNSEEIQEVDLTPFHPTMLTGGSAGITKREWLATQAPPPTSEDLKKVAEAYPMTAGRPTNSKAAEIMYRLSWADAMMQLSKTAF